MRPVLLAVTLVGLIPAPVLAQQYDYHLLLDSTAAAAGGVLLRNGHHPDRTRDRPDGYTERSFTTLLPDSGGAPARGDLHVTIVSQGNTITRIGLRADSHGDDTLAVKAAAQFFVTHLKGAMGRPASENEDSDWCWSTRRRFIDLTLDRAYGGVSLTIGYGAQDH